MKIKICIHWRGWVYILRICHGTVYPTGRTYFNRATKIGEERANVTGIGCGDGDDFLKLSRINIVLVQVKNTITGSGNQNCSQGIGILNGWVDGCRIRSSAKTHVQDTRPIVCCWIIVGIDRPADAFGYIWRQTTTSKIKWFNWHYLYSFISWKAATSGARHTGVVVGHRPGNPCNVGAVAVVIVGYLNTI